MRRTVSNTAGESVCRERRRKMGEERKDGRGKEIRPTGDFGESDGINFLSEDADV